MPSLSNNVIPITTTHQRDMELGFRRLADAAARGEIVGAAYTAIDASGGTHQGLIGSARSNRFLAHYGASRLTEMLLWPERYRIKP